MNGEIVQLAAAVTVAAVFGLMAVRWRQPLIIAYILTGLLLTQTGWLPSRLQPLWQVFSDFGIMLLLFLVGLEINYPALRRVGWTAVVIGIGQVVLTFVAGFFLALLLGLTPLVAAYIAAALTFSSTVIVVKLLSEKNELASLYGKMALGILLVQDIAAILLLVVLGAGLNANTSVAGHILLAILKGGALFVLIFWLGRKIMPRLFDKLAHSTELLFLASIAWLFVMAVLAERLGFSLAGGGFLAGLALANSAEHWQIASRIRPLRDFFIALFFIFLGSSLVLTDIRSVLLPIIIFTVFVLIGNPLIVMVIMRSMGYHHRTSFLTGLSIAQISEFSFVLAALGARLGHLPPSVVTVITAVGVLTISISASFILHGQTLYTWFRPALKRWFGSTVVSDELSQDIVSRPIVLIGAHRTGRSILAHLRPTDVVVLDFDPDVAAALRREGYAVIFGDAAEPEILDRLDWQQVRLIISTSPQTDDHQGLLAYLRHRRLTDRPKVVLRTETAAEARLLYQQGADYVLLPSLTAGQYLGQAISRDLDLQHIAALRQRDLALLPETISD